MSYGRKYNKKNKRGYWYIWFFENRKKIEKILSEWISKRKIAKILEMLKNKYICWSKNFFKKIFQKIFIFMDTKDFFRPSFINIFIWRIYHDFWLLLSSSSGIIPNLASISISIYFFFLPYFFLEYSFITSATFKFL